MASRRSARRMDTVCSMLTPQEKDRIICGVVHAKIAMIDWQAAAIAYGVNNASSFKRMYYMTLSKLKDLDNTARRTEEEAYEHQREGAHENEAPTLTPNSLVVKLPALKTLNLPDPAPLSNPARNLRSAKRKISKLHVADNNEELSDNASDFEQVSGAARSKKARKGTTPPKKLGPNPKPRNYQKKSNGKNNTGRRSQTVAQESASANNLGHDQYCPIYDNGVSDHDAEGSPDPEADSPANMYHAVTAEPNQYHQNGYNDPSIGLVDHHSYDQNPPQSFLEADQQPLIQQNLHPTITREGWYKPANTQNPPTSSRKGHPPQHHGLLADKGPPARFESERLACIINDGNDLSEPISRDRRLFNMYNSISKSFDNAAMGSMSAQKRPPNLLGRSQPSKEKKSNLSNHKNSTKAYKRGIGMQQSPAPTASMVPSPLSHSTSYDRDDTASSYQASRPNPFLLNPIEKQIQIRNEQRAVRQEIQRDIRAQQEYNNAQLGLQYNDDGSAGIVHYEQSPEYAREQVYARALGHQHPSAGHNYTGQNYAAQSYPEQHRLAQSFLEQAYPEQNYIEQNYPEQEYPERNYGGPNYAAHTYPEQSYPAQNYPSPNNYAAQTYPGQKYPAQDYTDQAYPPPNNYPLPIEYPSPNSPGQNYPAQSHSEQTYTSETHYETMLHPNNSQNSILQGPEANNHHFDLPSGEHNSNHNQIDAMNIFNHEQSTDFIHHQLGLTADDDNNGEQDQGTCNVGFDTVDNASEPVEV